MSAPSPSRPRVLLSWSSGKDSAWALHVLREAGEADTVGLLTTFNQSAGRVAMHAVRESLVDAQAEAAGLPLIRVPLPSPCPNDAYRAAMAAGLLEAVKTLAITHVAFGDLFLADIRQYRERQLADLGLIPLFPLWGLPTATLVRDMLDGGLRARLTCLDPARVPAEFAGRELDAELIAALPAGVDPAGENGEFHTFAFAGPMFSRPIAVTRGEIVTRDGFVFADLIPAGAAA